MKWLLRGYCSPFSRMMFLQCPLYILLAVFLGTGHAIPIFDWFSKLGSPGDTEKENSDDPKLNTQDPFGLEELFKKNCLPGIPANKGDAGLGALVPMVTEFQKQELLQLKDQLNSFEKALQLNGKIQKVGKKILATNGKEVDFATSKTTCEAIGGNIATPMNDEENNAILTFVKEHNRYAFLGVKEGLVPGKFSYLDGTPVTYTNWYKNEPNSKGQEQCVEMYTDGKWNDKGCNQNRLTICEF
ncbi:pulmonary surfactant-associated protein A-like [Bombina bombina]|uniref:pulmonary surfactant-associated protein A-like n=1 Tax=Bombina bombina TaxID=8345 RepID=UPI00235AA9A2|nr:pulmonary surfactant-associated protein A-like [Bombina bombina]